MATPNSNLTGPVTNRKARVYRRYKRLEDDRSSWRTHWIELSDHILPRRGRFLLEDSANNRGRKRSNKIVDSTATYANRVLTAGLMSGMTNPTRPWFRFGIEDKDLEESRPVMEWLELLAKTARRVLNKSNFYNTASSIYSELGVFGTAPMWRQSDYEMMWRYRALTAGEYVIAENEVGKVDTLGREFTMTVSQVVEQFAIDRLSGKADWSGISDATKSLWDRGNYDALVPIIHLVEPKREGEFEPGRIGPEGKPFRDAYLEAGSNDSHFLAESGHDKFPAYVPRWDVLPGDVYGRSPGMDVLGDVRQLQHEQKRKAQALDKMVNPPMTAPVSLRNKPSSTLPGGVTYIDAQQGQQGFVPTYVVQPRLAEFMADIQEVQERVKTGMYSDLFAMMIESDRRQITAYEVAQKQAEKLVLLGPILQRLHTEYLDPVLEDVIDSILEAELMPPPPQEIEGAQIEIGYISLLAQAQEAVAAGSIERVLAFAGNAVAVFPDLADVVDADEALREYRRIIGAPVDMLRSASDVVKMREERQAKENEQAAMEAIPQAAQAGKVLSETDSRSPNALTDLLGGVDV